MTTKRAYAASIVYNGDLHIFGGTCCDDDWTSLTSVETISPGGTVTAIESSMKFPLSAHGISSVNETFSIITGGRTSGDPNGTFFRKTWYYNHVTKKFIAGPDLNEERQSHGSGFVMYKNVKTPVVAGGWGGGGFLYHKSTEFLIEGKWLKGKYSHAK